MEHGSHFQHVLCFIRKILKLSYRPGPAVNLKKVVCIMKRGQFVSGHFQNNVCNGCFHCFSSCNCSAISA